MLKQVQKKITQSAGITTTEISLGSSNNTIITQCSFYSANTGNAIVYAGGAASTEVCFGVHLNADIVFPLQSFLEPIHNLTNTITIVTDTFSAGDIIHVIINYREFENINTPQSSITLSKYAITTNTIGITPLLANSGIINFNIKSVFVVTSSNANIFDLKLTSTEFPSGIPLVPQDSGSYFYRVMATPNQTLLPPASTLSLDQSLGVDTSVFISYTQVKP